MNLTSLDLPSNTIFLQLGISLGDAEEIGCEFSRTSPIKQLTFFDLLLPYLPTAEKLALKTIQGAATVSYKEADLKLSLATAETLNLLLHIAVPDYNLNLNLNLTIRVEDNEAFFRLAELMGLVKVESV